ncbi:MAG: hypothetical protein AB7K09_12280 [Planctomycetota bacterium]
MAKKKAHRPFSFRIYNAGCALLAGTAVIAAVVILILSTYERRVVVCAPPRAPKSLAPLLGPDPMPPLPPAGTTAADTLIGDRRFDHGARRLRLELATGTQPEALAPVMRANYVSFGAACNMLGINPARARLLPSADLMFSMIGQREDAIAVGIELAFVRGVPSERIPSLAAFLQDLAEMTPTSARPGVTAAAIAELRAWIALALQELDEPLTPAADADRLAALANEFDASTLYSEPHGWWAASDELRSAFRATRVLMMPLSPEAVAAAVQAVGRDEPRGRAWRAHYTRWLAVLRALYGPSSHDALTLAVALAANDDARGTAFRSPLSLLPWRLHVPADSLVVAARLAEARFDAKADVTRDDPVEFALGQLAHEMVVSGGGIGTSDAGTTNWLDLRLAARLDAVALTAKDAATTPVSGQLGAGRVKLALGEHFKWMRLSGLAAAGLREERGTAVNITRGLGCEPDISILKPVEGAPLVEPQPAAFARAAVASIRLPALLAPHLTPAALETITVAQLPGRQPVSVALMLAETVRICRTISVVAAAEAGVDPPDATDAARISPDTMINAVLWLNEDFHVDPELTTDVRDVWPVGSLPDGRTLWIGVNGVRLVPLTVSAAEGSTSETGREWLLLLPVLDRELRATATLPPSRDYWRLLDEWTSAAGRHQLTR